MPTKDEIIKQLKTEIEQWHAHISKSQPHYQFCPFCGKPLVET
jgi:hypothetical protein